MTTTIATPDNDPRKRYTLPKNNLGICNIDFCKTNAHYRIMYRKNWIAVCEACEKRIGDDNLIRADYRQTKQKSWVAPSR